MQRERQRPRGDVIEAIRFLSSTAAQSVVAFLTRVHFLQKIVGEFHFRLEQGLQQALLRLRKRNDVGAGGKLLAKRFRVLVAVSFRRGERRRRAIDLDAMTLEQAEEGGEAAAVAPFEQHNLLHRLALDFVHSGLAEQIVVHQSLFFVLRGCLQDGHAAGEVFCGARVQG